MKFLLVITLNIYALANSQTLHGQDLDKENTFGINASVGVSRIFGFHPEPIKDELLSPSYQLEFSYNHFKNQHGFTTGLSFDFIQEKEKELIELYDAGDGQLYRRINRTVIWSDLAISIPLIYAYKMDKFTPFVGIQIGFNILETRTIKDSVTYYYEDYQEYFKLTYTDGLFLGGMIGVNYELIPNFALTIKFVHRYYYYELKSQQALFGLKYCF
ncbi:MAG: hypothetical protein GQ574_26120 [Crocinitomix sp.]|nr:hypothetical protein [Crocinitomix sp.]